MTKNEAAKNLRRAIGASKNYCVGWILKGDDDVIQAARDFDAAWGSPAPAAKPGEAE